MQHAEAIEADLLPDVDLLDLYRPEADLSLRRVWVLVSGRLLVETEQGFTPITGTALARSISGEPGDWSRLDSIVASALGVKLPPTKETVEWKKANQQRIKQAREDRERRLRAAREEASE